MVINQSEKANNYRLTKLLVFMYIQKKRKQHTETPAYILYSCVLSLLVKLPGFIIISIFSLRCSYSKKTKLTHTLRKLSLENKRTLHILLALFLQVSISFICLNTLRKKYQVVF